MYALVRRRSTIATTAKTLSRLVSLVLATLVAVSCQTDPEKPQGRQTYTADLPTIPDTLMPQRGVIKAQSDTATATFTVLPANIKIDLDAPPAETVKVDLWRAGVKMYELDYVHSGSQKLVYTRSKRENTLGVTLLRRIYPSSDSLAFVAEFAKLLVENDPLVLSLGFPAKSIEGVDTALVMRKAMEIVAAKQLPVSSVIPKGGPWALGLDSTAVHARIQELVREGKIEVDTAKLFPPYPMRTKNGIALDAQLVAGGPAVGVTGAFEATYKVVNLSSRVLRDGQESKDFEIPTLAFSEYPKLLDLSGKMSIRAKESAAAGSYTLEITAQDDSLRKAVSSVDFQVVPAADKQGPQIEITSPAANTVLENAVDKIDVKAVVSDPSGVDSVWIDNRAASLIDGKWTVEGVSIPVTNLGYKVVVRARDSKGNESKADILVGRMSPLDPGAPITSVVQPKETEFPFDSASVLVRWKIEDPRAEVTKVWIGGQEATKEDGFVWARRVSLPPTGTPTTITFLGVNAKNDSTQKFVQLTRKIDTATVIPVPPEPVKFSWVGGADILGAEDSVVKTSMRLTGLKGSSVRIQQVSSLKDIAADTAFTMAATNVDLEVPLHFAPKANMSGKAGITLSAICGAESTSVQFQFVVAARNDAPSFKLSKTSVDLNGNAVQSFSKWADEMSPGPSDESGQKLRFQFEQLDATELLVALPAIDSVGTLKVQAKPGISGVARFQVRLLDNGDSLAGNKNSSGWVAFQVAVNAPPTLTLPARTYSLWQNSVQSPGSVVLADDETSVGSLVLSKSSSNAQVLPADSVYISGTGASRKLTFRPVRDQVGLVTVYLTVKDSMGGSLTDSMQVQVNAMNRAPSFTLASASVVLQNYNRDSLLLKCVSAESANDLQQYIKERRVDLIGAPQDTVLTAKATLDAEGTLHLPRRPNLRGWFTFRITIKDNGGTDNGGVDSVSKDLKIFFADTIIDSDDRNIYRYVVLGKRAWLAENLRKTPRWGASTVAMKDSLGGYLYDWAQAFDLDSVACYGKNCADQVVPVTQGLCPVGWNIPDSLEWRLMMNWAAQGGTDSQAVVRLKSKTGWGPQTYGLGAIFLDPGLDQWGFGITDNYSSYSSPGWRAGLYWARRWQSTNDPDNLDQLAAGFSSAAAAAGTYSESFTVYGMQYVRYAPKHPVRCIKSLPPGQWQ